MRRGTTPTCTFTVDADLTGWHCYLTFKAGKLLTTKTPDELGIVKTDTGSAIVCNLTQSETLAMKKGKAQVQLRAVDPATGTAVASEIDSLTIDDVLYQEVIS